MNSTCKPIGIRFMFGGMVSFMPLLRRTVILLFMGCYVSGAFGQNKIIGRVVDAETGEALPSANAFFAGTLIGGPTNKDGWFSISGFRPGKYDFTVSFVGYVMYQQAYTFTGTEQIRLLIKLSPDTQQLAAVVVTPNDHEKKENYALFKKLFLGESKLAKSCDIKNGDDIYLYRDHDQGMLIGHAGKPIVVENKALGYRIQYHLVLFQYQFFVGRLDVYGIPQFEEMTPKDEEKRNDWEQKRAEVYAGSTTHFMRSLVKGRLKEQNFHVARIIQVPNPKRPPEAVLKRRMDSLDLLLAKPSAPKQTEQLKEAQFKLRLLRAQPLTLDSMMMEELQGNEIMNADTLGQVKFTGELDIVYGSDLKQTKEGRIRLGEGEHTRVLIHAPFKVYENGYFDNLGNLFFQGYWSTSEKLPMLLPLDYQIKGHPD